MLRETRLGQTEESSRHWSHRILATQDPGCTGTLPIGWLLPLHTTGAAARSKQHLEVVLTVLPAFKLQMGSRASIILSALTALSGQSLPQADKHPLCYPSGGPSPPREGFCRKCEQWRDRGRGLRGCREGAASRLGDQDAEGGPQPAVRWEAGAWCLPRLRDTGWEGWAGLNCTCHFASCPVFSLCEMSIS